MINVICDNALVTGFATGVHRVDRQAVCEVCRDYDFEKLQSNTAAADVGFQPAESAHDPLGVVATTAADPADVEPVAPRRLTLFGAGRPGARG